MSGMRSTPDENLPQSFRHRHCPVCGADAATPVYSNRMAPIADLDMSYEVGQCGKCGFGYATDLPSPETYAAYYRTLSKYDTAQSTQDIAPPDLARIRTAVELCKQQLSTDATIIDLGCGSGALLDGFRSAGFSRLYGIDPAPDAGRVARRLFGIDTVCSGSLAEAGERLPLAEAGLLCLTGVLEHLPCLDEDLAHLVDYLPETAQILIEVPALERFCQMPMEPFGEFSLEHIQYFDKPSLNRLMRRFGFAPVEQSIVAIPGLTPDSLFALYCRRPALAQPAAPLETSSRAWLLDYVRASQALLDTALARIAPELPASFFVYGAGSHSARLLPKLTEFGLVEQIAGVIDGNPNLQGKTIGKHRIYPPQFLAERRGETVLVSTFRAQQAVAQALRANHPLVLMYT